MARIRGYNRRMWFYIGNGNLGGVNLALDSFVVAEMLSRKRKKNYNVLSSLAHKNQFWLPGGKCKIGASPP